MKSRFGLLPLILAAALAGCATTAQTPPTLEQRFKSADVNGDGLVSRAEFTDFTVAEAFHRYDRNRDGFVSEEEFVAGGGNPVNFRRMNTGGTGKVTLAEAKSSQTARDTMVVPFDEADFSRNGYVTLEEYQQYLVRRDAAVR